MQNLKTDVITIEQRFAGRWTGKTPADVRTMLACGIPQWFGEPEYDAMLSRAGEFGLGFERIDNQPILKPYRFRFAAEGTTHTWIRFYSTGMEQALADCKSIALREYPDAHSFSIESDQDSSEVRRAWGLDS